MSPASMSPASASQPSDPVAPVGGPLPLTLLTGFLGSGKTTLLSHLLRQPGLAGTAVIMNEFGEIGLDHDLIARGEDSVVELMSGCLCCTIRGDLHVTLGDLLAKREAGTIMAFDRVVIETTGLADPAPILHTLMTAPGLVGHFRLDGVVTVVDGMVGAETLDQQPEAVKQVAVADRLLISKSDLAAPEALEALQGRLARINPGAPQRLVVQGVISPEAVLESGLIDPRTGQPNPERWLRAEAYEGGEAGPAQADPHRPDPHRPDPHRPAPASTAHAHRPDHECANDHGHDHGHDHGRTHTHTHTHTHDPNRHGDGIRAFCVTRDHPLRLQAVSMFLQILAANRQSDILRIKGIIDILERPGQPVVIHGVQTVFHPPVWLEAWPSADHRTRLVFITRDIEPERIQALLDMLDSEATPSHPMKA